MNKEISPRVRTFLSSLAAIALTTLLASSLVESSKSVQWLGSGALYASVSTVSTDALDNTGLARSV